MQSSLGRLELRARSYGHRVELLGNEGTTAATLELGNQSFRLDRVELSAPSEHRLGGVSAALELILWFEGVGHSVRPLAFSLLFRSGRENAALTQLLDALPPRGTYEARDLGGELDLSALLPLEGLVFSYEGTTTTPPCHPTTRLVLAQMGELSDAQLEKLGHALGASSRAPVPLGERAVTLLPLKRAASAP